MNGYCHYFVDCSFDGKGTVKIFGLNVFNTIMFAESHLYTCSIRILLIGAFYLLLNSICYGTNHLHASYNSFKICLQFSFNLKNVTKSSTLGRRLTDNGF